MSTTLLDANGAARPNGKPRSDLFADAQRAILAALDLGAEYRALGVRIAGQANEEGWVACHAIGREDRDPSAAINVKTGRYRDHGGEGDSLSFFEAAARCGAHPDWRAARAAYAAKAGVPLPGQRAANHRDAKAGRGDGPKGLTLLDWTDGRRSLLGIWATGKPPIAAEAVYAAGGRWGEHRFGRDVFVVVALPVLGPDLDYDRPTGWIMMNSTGGKLPTKGGAGKKVKLTAGGKSGLVGCGLTREAIQGAEWVFFVEGVSDMLGVWSQIPEADRARFVVVTNSCGATERPRAEILELFRGAKVALFRDLDQAGRAGAERWMAGFGPVAKDARNVVLPAMEGGRKDLRDYFNFGRTFGDLLALVEAASTWKQPAGGRPQILLGLDESRVIDEAIEALGRQPIYQRAGALVHVVNSTAAGRIRRAEGAPRIAPVRQARLREMLASAADWASPGPERDEPCSPPRWVIEAVFARDEWPGIRHLTGTAEAPVLRPDGSVLQTPGYDELTGLLFHPSATYPLIPERPTLADAKRAVDELLEVVVNFPFATPTARSAWLAAAITPFARPAIAGSVPLFLVDKNSPGCGGSLIVDSIAWICTGRDIARTAAPREDDEFRKRITAIAMAGDPLILLDNINGTLGTAALDAALTGTRWSDRVLGASQMATVELAAVWYGSGNNVVLGADTARRVLPIRLFYPKENPEDRGEDEFLHPNLSAWITQERPRLAAAAVTIPAAYCAAGRPDTGIGSWGSFEEWSGLVRQAIVWAGQPDPAANRRETISAADEQTTMLRRLLAGWEEIQPATGGISVAKVLQILAEADASGEHDALRCLFGEWGKDGKVASPRSLGMKLHHFRGRIVGGKYLASRDDKMGVLWRVERTEDGEIGGTSGTRGTNSPPTHAGARARTHASGVAAAGNSASSAFSASLTATCSHEWTEEAKDGQLRISCRLCGKFFGYKELRS